MPLICLRLEVDHSKLVNSTLLNTYLGRGASERVVNGLIRRNEGDKIDATYVWTKERWYWKDAHQEKWLKGTLVK